MKKLTNYNYETKLGKYVSERTNVSKGVYDFKVFSDQKVIAEEEDVKVKTGRDLEKYIRKVINDYEETLGEVGGEEEISEEGDIEDAISEVFDAEEEKDDETEEFEDLKNQIETIIEKDFEDLIQEIESVFTNRKSPIEMKELFEKLDIKIMQIDDVSFKTTPLDLVYSVSGQNFLRIRPKPKRLDVLCAPDWYKDIIKLADDSEIEEAMVSITVSCEFIREKRSKKQ